MQLSSIRTWLCMVALLAGNLISLPMAHAQGEREAFFTAYKEGEALWAKGQLKAALVPYKKAAELVSGAFGERAADTGAIYNNYGQLLMEAGDFPEAETWMEKGLKVRESIRQDSPEVAASLNNLGELRRHQGKYADAVGLYERSLVIKESALGTASSPGPLRLSIAFSRNNLGICLRESGKFTESEEAFRKALATFEKELKPGDYRLVICKDNYAQTLIELGKFPTAQGMLEECLQLFRRNLPPNHPDLAVCASNLGFVYREQRHPEKAIPLYLECLAIQKKTLPDDHPNLGQTHNNLGVAYQDVGKIAEARTHLEQALAIRRKSLEKGHPSLAMSLNDLAFLEFSDGNNAKARPLYEEALQARPPALRQSLNAAMAVQNYARLLAATGDFEKASEKFSEARRAVRHHVGHVLPGLSEEEQLEFLQNRDRMMLQTALLFGMQHFDQPAVRSASAEWLLNGKGVSQEALGLAVLLNTDSSPGVAEVRQRLQSVRADLARQTFSTPKAGAAVGQIETLTTEEQKLSQKLARLTGFQTVSADWAALPALQKRLGEREVLIEFARVAADPQSPMPQTDRYAAWIIPRQGEIKAIELGSAADIDQMIARLHRELRDGVATLLSKGERDATDALKPAATGLAERLVHPILRGLPEGAELVLSPDSNLWLVPWSILPIESGSLLCEASPVRLVTSGRELLVDGKDEPSTPPALFANPDFDLAPAQVVKSTEAVLRRGGIPAQGASSVRIPAVGPLPGTAAEAALVSPSLEKWCDAKPALYEGRFATEGVLRSIHGPRVLVLSTHGFFLDKEANSLRNPLLRSGVLLAGVNSRDATSPGDDGVVTGLEVLLTDCRGTDLVILSACDTGLGTIQNGEGVAGLRQAFRQAGARSVVSTLWPIPDRDSALLMVDFVAALAEGKSKAQALRTAQRKRIEARREQNGAAHPVFWGAWTVTGGG